MIAADETFLAEIEALAEAATEGLWHWAGNVDTGEPYLATWIPGAGRCQVLSIGHEDRSTTGRAADAVRSYARENGLDPEEMVDEWAHDQFGRPVKEARLWFMTDLLAVPARDRVVYEVAPQATTRDDPAVYRADIVGIRHPDAEFIAAARTAVPRLVAMVRERDERIEAARALHGSIEGLCETCMIPGVDESEPWPCPTALALGGGSDG